MKELWEHKNSERLAAIIIDIYMYVYMSMAIIEATHRQLSEVLWFWEGEHCHSTG